MATISLPDQRKIVQAFAPKTTNASLTSQVVTLKGAVKAWLVLHFTQAVGHATTPTIKQATDIAAGTNAAGPTCARLGERRLRGDRYARGADRRRELRGGGRRQEQDGRLRDRPGHADRRLRLRLLHDRDLVAGDELRQRRVGDSANFQQSTMPSAILD
jgi:hypothetical protein